MPIGFQQLLPASPPKLTHGDSTLPLNGTVATVSAGEVFRSDGPGVGLIQTTGMDNPFSAHQNHLLEKKKKPNIQ
jgi:hypothetical protein